MIPNQEIPTDLYARAQSVGCCTCRPMVFKGDSPEVEIVLTRRLQRHAQPRRTILNSSFACSMAGSKVKE